MRPFLPAVLKAQLHWLHNKISSSLPAMSKRLPHSGQKVREPMILSAVDIMYFYFMNCYERRRKKKNAVPSILKKKIDVVA